LAVFFHNLRNWRWRFETRDVVALFLAGLVVYGTWMTAIPGGVKRFTSFYRKWQAAITDQTHHYHIPGASYHGMADWIKAHTDKGDIFAVTPAWQNFFLDFERGMVSNFKLAPPQCMDEWFQRMRALNGGLEFKNRGYLVKKEITENFRQLTYRQLSQIAHRYDAGYYLVDRERPELGQYLVYHNQHLWLYRL